MINKEIKSIIVAIIIAVSACFAVHTVTNGMIEHYSNKCESVKDILEYEIIHETLDPSYIGHLLNSCVGESTK